MYFFLLLLRDVKILSFTIIGHVACFGMAGFVCSLVYMVPLLGLLMLLRVLVIWVEVALGLYSSGLVAEWSPSDEF